jgi:hypothetical protein
VIRPPRRTQGPSLERLPSILFDSDSIGAGKSGFDSRCKHGFLSSLRRLPALGPTQVNTQCVLRVPIWGQGDRSRKLTTSLHLMTRLRMYGSVPPLRHMSSRRGVRQVISSLQVFRPKFSTHFSVVPRVFFAPPAKSSFVSSL